MMEPILRCLLIILMFQVVAVADDTIDVVDNNGRSFRGIPTKLTETELIVIRASDKKQFVLQRSRLTPETPESAQIFLKTKQEKKQIEWQSQIETTRKKLAAYSHRCGFGSITLYSSIKDCALQPNGYNSGVALLAPDRSRFHCYNLARHGVSSRAKLREYVGAKIQERMRGKTQPERDDLLKDIKVVEIQVGGWSGFEVQPSDIFLSVRSFYLERDGQFFGFSHGSPSGSDYRKNRSSISKLQINPSEWERILTTIKIE